MCSINYKSIRLDNYLEIYLLIKLSKTIVHILSQIFRLGMKLLLSTYMLNDESFMMKYKPLREKIKVIYDAILVTFKKH